MILNSEADPKGGGQDAQNKGLPNCVACGFLKIAAFCKAHKYSYFFDEGHDGAAFFAYFFLLLKRK